MVHRATHSRARGRISTALVVTVIVAALSAWLGFATTGFPAALAPPAEVPSRIRIDNARIVSMVPGAPEVQTGNSVLVVDGVIRAVGPPDVLDTGTDVLVVDAAGQTLLPGLIDAHVHLWDEAELCGYLAHGVTSVRNMGGMPFHLDLARRIEQGELLGPDFLTTGPILNSPGPNQQRIHQLVVTADDARAAVRAQYAAGYRTLKLYSNLNREAYDAIRDEAHKLGMNYVGHTAEGFRGEGVPYDRPFAIPFEDVLDDGYQTIEHVESIVWHGLRDRLDPVAMRELAGRIARAGVVVTPTLIAHDNLVRVASSRGAYLHRPGTETLNPLLQWFEAGNQEFWSAQDPEAREAPRAVFYRQATLMLHQAGVPLIAGTDAGIFTNIPGSSMTRELELLVESGLTAHEAIATATAVAGPALGLPDRGQVAPGFRANLLLVAQDPLRDVSVLEQPEAVMIRGVWLDAAALARLRQGARDTSVLRTARRLAAMLWAIH
ncbi:MAG: amidohydrolase family protein [Pseudomonadales bacterium]